VSITAESSQAASWEANLAAKTFLAVALQTHSLPPLVFHNEKQLEGWKRPAVHIFSYRSFLVLKDGSLNRTTWYN
jgi:hypothetical protein